MSDDRANPRPLRQALNIRTALRFGDLRRLQETCYLATPVLQRGALPSCWEQCWVPSNGSFCTKRGHRSCGMLYWILSNSSRRSALLPHVTEQEQEFRETPYSHKVTQPKQWRAGPTCILSLPQILLPPQRLISSMWETHVSHFNTLDLELRISLGEWRYPTCVP